MENKKGLVILHFQFKYATLKKYKIDNNVTEVEVIMSKRF